MKTNFVITNVANKFLVTGTFQNPGPYGDSWLFC